MATEYRQRPGVGDHFDDEDLVMSSAQQRRNWRGILIALMVIVAVLAMIVTSVVLLTPPQPEELSDSYSDLVNGDKASSDYYYNQRANDELWWRRRGMRTLRLSDVLTDSARIKLFNGTWISGNEMFYVTGHGDLAVMEVGEDGAVRTTRHLISKNVLRKLNGLLVSFELSPDRNHVLIGHDAKKVSGRNAQMTPVVLDDRRHKNGTGTGGGVQQQPYFLHAQWHKISTTVGKKPPESMALIVVYRYDLYYVPWSSELTATTTVVQETVADIDGKRNVTANGRTVDDDDDDDSGREREKNTTTTTTAAPKLSWEPWPHGVARRITTSGSGATVSNVGEVSNGVADYLYETEILKRSPAVWPSSGRYLMYATFDDRRVGEYKYSVYMKGGEQRDRDAGKRQEKQQQRKKKRRRRNSKVNATEHGDTLSAEYYLYPEIRTVRYPKANTPNPVVTLSVIVNLDQLGNPQVQPKIRTLTPPSIFQYTDDYYFTAVQWVNDGGGVGGNREIGDDESAGTSAAEVCVVWLNRAQNTSVTTLCKSPMWMCQETQVINTVGAGGGGVVGGGGGAGGIDTSSGRLRYRRNRENSANPSVRRTTNDASTTWSADQEDHRDQLLHRRRQQQQRGRRSRSRRRRAGDVNGAGGTDGPPRTVRYGGWVDATVGGAGGGVPSTGGGSDANTPFSSAAWWSSNDAAAGGNRMRNDGEDFAGDDGYAGVAGTTTTGAGYTVAALVRRGWETGDKELTPRAPVFAADGQGYVSVAPVRDEQFDGDGDGGEGRVRLRRPSSKQRTSRDRNAGARPESPRVGKYYAQVVAVNITKKLLASVTYGEPDENDDGGAGGNGKRGHATTKSWTVVRILAWDQRSDMIYFLAVPSGRGAPHHRHLYAVKFTNSASSFVPSADPSRVNLNHQQQNRKPVRHHSRPVCLSCNVKSNNVQRRASRDVGGKQNRMDEARDGRLRQQQRERWEHQKDNEAATAEEAQRRQQGNRRQHQQRDMQNRGATRYCTYYDAQFSRDGTHYALTCLGPSVPYVTLHRIVVDDDNNPAGVEVDTDDAQNIVQKRPNDSSYSFEFVALLENNTRLQDKYTNRVLLPGTRTFQLRLSGGRKLTISGGLHFNDPLSAANYYSNGGNDQSSHFSTIKHPDSDPLTVAQVRLYLPLGVYDPEADPRPEFMLNREINFNGPTAGNADATVSEAIPSDTNGRRRRRRSPSSSSRNKNDENDGTQRQWRPHKKQRQRRFKKLYPMLVVVNSDPGSQAITDRFSDRLGYTTGLLCSGSLGRTISGAGSIASRARYNTDERYRRNYRGRRSRRSSATEYYSSGRDDISNDPNDFYPDDDDEDANNNNNNNEYVVAVIDPGQGTWGRGYESLLALNYGVGNDEYGDSIGDNSKSSGLLGIADLRDQMEAVEYLLSSASTAGNDFKDYGQGYYSEERPRGSRGGRSRWFSSSSQMNRRYYSDDDDDDDGYDDDEEYEYDNYKNDNEDYYYYYYSNGGDNSDYIDDRETDDFHRNGDSKKIRRERRSTDDDTKENTETLRLPYVDSTKVALLGGGPISPSTQPSIYSGYATARMAMWQASYGGSPIIEKKTSEVGGDYRNRKEPVAIQSSFKCAITVSPIFSWRLYSSAFAERYYGYFGGNDGDTWPSYDRSDLIPLNESAFLPASRGKGINLLVIHGTADTTIHPQNSMMFVRGVMHQQQKQYSTSHNNGGSGRHNSNSSGGRIASGFPARSGTIRISQLVMPDADLSYSRMSTGTENDSPLDRHYQMINSLYGHISRYLATECFTGVGDGSRSRGIKVRGQRLRKRRRRWRTGNRDQDTLNDNIQQQRKERNGEHGRYRRNDIDHRRQHVSENNINNSTVAMKTKADDRNSSHGYRSNNIGWGNDLASDIGSPNNRKISSSSRKRKKENDDDVEDDEGSHNDEDSDDEHDYRENSDEEYDEEDEEKDDDK